MGQWLLKEMVYWVRYSVSFALMEGFLNPEHSTLFIGNTSISRCHSAHLEFHLGDGFFPRLTYIVICLYVVCLLVRYLR